MAKKRLELVSGRWYGWQMIPGYEGNRYVPYSSPVRISVVTPRKTGRGILRISFFNALYAEGVQDFDLDLCIMKHEPDYLIADLLYTGSETQGRAAVISNIEFDWLGRFCPSIPSARPPEAMSATGRESVSAYLNTVFPR